MSRFSHSPLLRALEGHAASMPDKVALVTADGESISNRSLLEHICQAARFLQGKGVKCGDRVLLSAHNDAEFVFFYFAAHAIGAVNVVVDAKNNADQISHIASLTKPMLCLGLTVDGVESLTINDLSLGQEPTDYVRPDSLGEGDLADIMFTSGTTGHPKGVKLSHYNVYSSASNINSFIGNTCDDVELVALPLCHSFGLGRVRCNVLTGGTVVLHGGFANLKSVFAAMKQYGVTGFGMVPAVWAYIHKFSGERIGIFADRLRYIEIGSAAMPTEEKQLLCRLFPTTRICMHYGLTEASRSLFMEFHDNINNLATVGRPVATAVSVKIMDADGKEVKAGEQGEICVSGNMVTSAYLLPQDNEEAFWGDYFRTGDWGYMDAEGNVYLVSRKKELINVGGKKVSPIEIEDALERIGVGESMCVAVADPDGIFGEVPKALLVRGTFSLSIDEIKSLLPQRLAAYKLPRLYEVVDSIPKTSSGKKKRVQ